MAGAQRSVRDVFSVAPGMTYLDAATYGLPPRATVAVMESALATWAGGTADWVEDWDRPAEEARTDFARLTGVAPDQVALLPAVSVGVAYVAATLGPGDVVLAPSNEFTSVTYPLQVAAGGQIELRRAPIERLAEAVTRDTKLVATSLVQMQTGRRADLPAVLHAAERVGARVLLDVSQAVPFTRADEDLAAVDYLLTHGYKHLLCPRGAAFMAIRPDRLTEAIPTAANWRSARSPYGDFFNERLTTGDGARAFDVSLAWLAWVGARSSLRLLVGWRDEGHLDEVWSLADRLSVAAGLGPATSTLVCVPVTHPAEAGQALRDAGVKASVRGESIRLSVHLWNDGADIDRALTTVAPYRP